MKRPKKYFLSFVFFLCSLFCFAQRAKIDSLQKLLLTQKEDTNKVKTLNILCSENISIDSYKNAVQNANDAIILATKLHYQIGIGKAYNWLGVIYQDEGNFPESLKNLFVALKIHEKINNKGGIATAYNNIANIYGQQQNHVDALKYHSLCLQMWKYLKVKKRIAWASYSVSHDYEALAIIQKDDSLLSIALSYLNESLEIFNESENQKGIADSYNSIGSILYNQRNYPEALKKFNYSLAISKKSNMKYGIAQSYINIGETYLKLDNIVEANNYLYTGLQLSKELNYKQFIRESYYNVAELDSVQGNYKSAYENYKMYIIYNDSLLNEENTKKSVRIAMQYEFDKKETQAKAEQDKKDAVAAAESRKQRIILFSVIGGLLLVVLFARFIYRSLIQIKKKNIHIT